jgi:hypothetical protein
MKILSAIRWEFVRNAPVIVLLVAAVWYWGQEKKAQSMACALGGAVARPLLVRFTDPTLGIYREPTGVTVVNIISMGLLHVLLVAYLGTEANWSNWKVDLGLGSLAAVSLAVSQGLVLPGAPLVTTVLPSLGLAVGGALAFVGIRTLKGRTLFLALASAAVLAAAVTLVVSAIGSIVCT